MKFKVFNIIILCTYFWAGQSIAEGGWTGKQQISMLYVVGSEEASAAPPVLVRLNNMINPDLCSGEYYYRLAPENKSFDNIYKLLLDAFENGTSIGTTRRVNLFVSGCSGGGTNGRPKILHAQMLRKF